jgi:uncharacterized OB-fold protein
VPVPNAETRPFWEGCARGELLYQFCAACARPQFYPRMHCAGCQGRRLEWRRSAGKGTVYSHTTVRRAPTPAFKAMLPYVIALVDLDEGFRMMMNVLDCDPSQIVIGSRVRVVFRESEGAVLPQAVPA